MAWFDPDDEGLTEDEEYEEEEEDEDGEEEEGEEEGEEGEEEWNRSSLEGGGRHRSIGGLCALSTCMYRFMCVLNSHEGRRPKALRPKVVGKYCAVGVWYRECKTFRLERSKM